MFLLLLNFLPIATAMKFASFTPTMPLMAYPDTSTRYQCATDGDQLKTNQLQEVSGFLRTNVGATGVNNNVDRACTIVASQDEAAVYICNINGRDAASACGTVDGNHVADAIDDILNDGNCVKPQGADGLASGTAWVTGPLVNPSFQCDQLDASYIQLVGCDGVTW